MAVNRTLEGLLSFVILHLRQLQTALTKPYAQPTCYFCLCWALLSAGADN